MLKYNNITPNKIYYRNVLIKAVKGCDGSNVWEYQEPAPTHDYSQDYLTFVPLASTTFQCTKAVSYSLDDGATWTNLSANTATPTVHIGDKILWKAQLTTSGSFKSSIGRFNVEGNAMSLIYGDNFVGQTSLGRATLHDLFTNETRLISAENLVLPATTLTASCYSNMFQSCTSLTTAPELPATTLVNYCYRQMFENCTSLTTAPELPATTLAYQCYEYMFQNCTSLKSIKCLATDISATYCTNNWVNGVAASGTFTKAASMTSWTTGTSGIPSGWSVVDA